MTGMLCLSPNAVVQVENIVREELKRFFNQPNWIVEHLREADRNWELVPRRYGIGKAAMSLWECDKLYPKWGYWPTLVDYLGFDPFNDSAFGRPKGNESHDVAILALQSSKEIGHKILLKRLQRRKNRHEIAQELGECQNPMELGKWSEDAKR